MPCVDIISPELYSYGALLIAATLERSGVAVTVSNTFKVNFGQDIVGISLHSISQALEYADEIERLKIKSGAHIVVGGPVSVAPEIVFRLIPSTDVVVVGEGEETVVEVVNRITRGKDLDSVSGVAYRKGNTVINTGSRNVVSLAGRPTIRVPPDLGEQRVRDSNIYVETHRGCTNKCTFCLTPRLFGNTIRSRPLNEILEEARALSAGGVTKVAISGGTVSLYGYDGRKLNEEAFHSLLQQLACIFGKQNVTAADLRVDKVTPNILQSIATFTCGNVEYGIESGSERVLRRLCKGFGIDRVNESVRIAREAGLNVTGSFVTGLPYETDSDFEDTRNLVKSLGLYNYAINIADPIPGTPLFEEILSTPDEANPLFQNAGEPSFPELSIAEFRALHLLIDAYEIRYGGHPSTKLIQGFLARVKNESQRIKKVIKACSFLRYKGIVDVKKSRQNGMQY